MNENGELHWKWYFWFHKDGGLRNGNKCSSMARLNKIYRVETNWFCFVQCVRTYPDLCFGTSDRVAMEALVQRLSERFPMLIFLGLRVSNTVSRNVLSMRQIPADSQCARSTNCCSHDPNQLFFDRHSVKRNENWPSQNQVIRNTMEEIATQEKENQNEIKRKR